MTAPKPEIEVEVRPIRDQEGLRECERLQREIWGFTELEVVPRYLLKTAIEGGGCLLGAYDKVTVGERLIGFVFSILGLHEDEDKPKHCSFMAGVLSDLRYRGVGYRLKLAQREFALNQGVELITWTFDPLQSANAYFNFKKLGVISQSYKRNFYGEMEDELNRGLESDRFSVEWWLTSPRVKAKIEGGFNLPSVKELLSVGAERVNRTVIEGGWPVNTDYDLGLKGEKLLVEIPTDTPGMREEDLELARRWRAETREIFEHYLTQGYLVSEFIMEEGKGFYLLERASKERVLNRR